MPAPNGEYLASLPEVREAVSRLRGCRQEYRQFFAELVGRIGALSDALVERQKCLEHRANDQQEVEADAPAAFDPAQLEALEHRLREPLEQVLAATTARLEHESAAPAFDPSPLEQRLDQLTELIGQLAEAQAAAAAMGSEEATEPDELQQQLDAIEQQRREWDNERTAMVTELEVVRNRAAEMTDLLDQQKRGAEQQQVQWSEELRQMRQLLGGIMEHMEQHEVAAPAAGPAPRALAAADDGEGKPEQPSTPSETESSDDDPVLDSVMAQFEILQKDIARRKKAKS